MARVARSSLGSAAEAVAASPSKLGSVAGPETVATSAVTASATAAAEGMFHTTRRLLTTLVVAVADVTRVAVPVVVVVVVVAEEAADAEARPLPRTWTSSWTGS